MSFTFQDTVSYLRRRLQEPLPGPVAQGRLAPSHRDELQRLYAPGRPCREAAVLVLLFPLQGAPAVVLTVRHAGLKQHAGQISFPGGRREPDESLEATALREAFEEVGLDPERVELLGSLTPLFVAPSNFCVHPFVGVTPEVPDLVPHDDEVETILYVPVHHLLDPAMLLREPWLLRGREVEVPFFSYESFKVWGATAMMLAELLALFEELAEGRAEAD